MKDIEKMFDEGLAIVRECCGADALEGRIYRPISISNSRSRWGCCNTSADRKRHRITISGLILADEVPNDAVMSVIVHEILHSCKNGGSHKGMWKIYAVQVMRKHPELKITRTTPASMFHLEDTVNRAKKYVVKCTECGREFHRARISGCIKNPERYRCKCGGKIIRIK